MTHEVEHRPSTVILLRETVAESIASDICTFAMIMGVVAVGFWLHDIVAETIGFMMLVWSYFTKVDGSTKRLRLSPQQAANRLFLDFGVRANDA